ncbi:MAG: NTP transferase domain-containing protein [Gammaproteobacteria bacterium]|nr:NTP transferase domain-containing protein [Gammaproteobacteria bacterium]
MKAIIIGAGDGIRLKPHTDEVPKCLITVGPKRLLDYLLDGFAAAGIEDVSFIGGKQIEVVREAFPDLRYYHDDDSDNHDILGSLMYARPAMKGPIIVTYSDIIFPEDTATRLLATDADITLVVDRAWRKGYVGRTLHPVSEAENVVLTNGNVTDIGKGLDSPDGEFIGLAKFSRAAASLLFQRWFHAKKFGADKPFGRAANLQSAYLTDMVLEMLKFGATVEPFCVEGGWMELDTPQDLERMQAWLAESS